MKMGEKIPSSYESREFLWIRRIRETMGEARHGGIGIGDDAAFLPEGLLWTTDAMVEGVHFLSSWPMDGVGYKSLASSASDIVAMGGFPLYALLTTGLPSSFQEKMYATFLHGFQRAMQDFGIALMGGDTVRSDALFFSVTVLGKPFSKPLLRSGAQVGDTIYVSGMLGTSALGLETLLRQEPKGKEQSSLVRAHLYPPCRIMMMQELVVSYTITAAIDCSDGFVADLDHIADESGVGYEIEITKLPVPEGPREDVPWGIPWRYALGGGEDYEIIFTSPDNLPSRVGGVAVTPVGKIVPQGRTLLWQGHPIEREKIPRGYTHF
ncbi:MAG: thiamine-phosphate kinase [Brevinematales bacterium]|nr:thiamine-phosphate kinase [Brevinematales bacterium]